MIIVLLILIVTYLFLYFSGLPYWLTPSVFYVWNTVVYVLINIWYLLKYRKKNVFCFELLFALSFWICCFFLLVLMEQLDPSILTHSQILYFSDNLLCRSCALCMLGYLSYMVGLIPIGPNSFNNIECKQSPKVNKVLNLVTTMLIILFFMLGGGDFINSYNQSVVIDALEGGRFGKFGTVMIYLIMFINTSSVSNFITTKYEEGENVVHFIKKLDPLFVFNVLIMSIFFLLCGYRSGAMQILLPIFALLSNKSVLKAKHTFVVILCGVVVMSLIGQLRSQTSNINEIASDMTLLEFFRDFGSANAATPSLIEYVDFYGSANFKNAWGAILSIVPLLPTLIFGVCGSDFLMPPSSHIYTYDICQSYFSGMGTNVIGDLYYTGGFFCVLISLFLFGWIIRKVSVSTSKYALLALVCLIGNAFFMPRVEFFFITRICSFPIIIYWLINMIFPVRRF